AGLPGGASGAGATEDRQEGVFGAAGELDARGGLRAGGGHSPVGTDPFPGDPAPAEDRKIARGAPGGRQSNRPSVPRPDPRALVSPLPGRGGLPALSPLSRRFRRAGRL